MTTKKQAYLNGLTGHPCDEKVDVSKVDQLLGSLNNQDRLMIKVTNAELTMVNYAPPASNKIAQAAMESLDRNIQKANNRNFGLNNGLTLEDNTPTSPTPRKR